MEEKERYVIRYDLDYNQCLIDTEENQGVGDYIQIVKLLNQQSKQIKELEKQLAESEKNFVVANNLRKNADEVLLNYKTEKYGLDKTIQELRKMKLSLPEKEWYYKGFENCERQMSSHIADLTLEVKKLKQQLITTEKALELACEEIGIIEAKFDSAYIRANGYLLDYFKTTAKEMLENE